MNARILLAAFALIAAPLSAAPTIAAAQAALPQTRGVPVTEITSPGGIKAWLVSDKTVPTIEFRAYWKGGGGASDPAGKEGLSGFMAEMLTQGAGDLDDQAFNNRLQDLNMALDFGAGATAFR